MSERRIAYFIGRRIMRTCSAVIRLPHFPGKDRLVRLMMAAYWPLIWPTLLAGGKPRTSP